MSTGVLILEDEFLIAELLKQALERKGFKVDCAYSGRDGLALFNPSSHRVVVMDLGLGDMRGEQFLKTINGPSLGIPIIITTGADCAPVQEAMRSLGATHFLEKPYALASVIATVKLACAGSNIPFALAAAPSEEVADKMTSIKSSAKDIGFLAAAQKLAAQRLAERRPQEDHTQSPSGIFLLDQQPHHQ